MKLTFDLGEHRLPAMLRKQDQQVALAGNRERGTHEHGIGLAQDGNAQQRQLHRERVCWQAVLAEPEDEDLFRRVDRTRYLGDLFRRIDETRFLFGQRFAAPEVGGRGRLRVAARWRDSTRLPIAAFARDRLAHGHLQIGIALESELLAELHYARLADAERVGELLRGVVAQQVCILEDEIRDAPLDRRHLVPFRADFYERGHSACHQTVMGSSPRISRMPRPGASVSVISESLNSTPPSTGLNLHSDGPSRSTLVITSAFATAMWAAAATLMLVSTMQPIMQSIWYIAAMSAMCRAFEMPPVFMSLMLMMSAARMRMSSITSVGPKTLSSAMIGVCTRSVTYFMPSRSCAR